ncbi:hypothetical protein QBC35DRAFT_534241 [Podospora australis]|uniref:Secreted protein n=1 Tax=Podospora australis TaxID=1536484 RepID=A0AAN6WNM4_9PEZI|nr:hypothetical protein QBC35DRAFT_534241 [Podospora australis]
MKSTLILSLLPFTALATPLVARQDERAKFNGTIVSSGSGCPPGSVHPVFNPNNEYVQITLDSQIAQVGPGFGEADREKLCRISLFVTHREGRSTVNARATIGGDVTIPAASRITGTLHRTYVVATGGEYRPADLTFTDRNVAFNQVDAFTVSPNVVGPAQRVLEYVFEGSVRLQTSSQPSPSALLKQAILNLDISQQS